MCLPPSRACGALLRMDGRGARPHTSLAHTSLASPGAHHFQIVLVLIPSVIVGIGWGALVVQEMACVQRSDDGVER